MIAPSPLPHHRDAMILVAHALWEKRKLQYHHRFAQGTASSSFTSQAQLSCKLLPIPIPITKGTASQFNTFRRLVFIINNLLLLTILAIVCPRNQSRHINLWAGTAEKWTGCTEVCRNRSGVFTKSSVRLRELGTARSFDRLKSLTCDISFTHQNRSI